MSAYWREIAQSGFLEVPLMPGSVSIFGKNPAEHFQFANEICAEKLVRKHPVFNGGRTTMAWDWVTTGAEHYCDCLSGCFALASWFRCYDPLSATIDLSALGKPRQQPPSGGDLFDPRANPAILENAGVDSTEGTGVDVPVSPDLPAAVQPEKTVNPLRIASRNPKTNRSRFKKSQIWWKK